MGLTRFALSASLGSAVSLALAAPAVAQGRTPSLRAQLNAAQSEIAAQRAQNDSQEARIRALEARLAELVAASSASRPGSALAAAEGSASAGTPGDPAGAQQAPLERVGNAPSDYDRPPEVAVLGEQGSVITRAGQLTGEVQLEYGRADRNRAVFRGIELIDAVLIGVFDVNESRQDVLTAAAGLRYGVSKRFEVGVRVPYVYRSDASVLAPIQGSTANDAAATIDNSAKGSGIGDIEVTARYQLTTGRGGGPYLIANLQGVIPTGEGPFSVPRDSLGRAERAATGSGFYGISPSITAILPTDPVVLFGTLGYTFNLKRKVNTQIPPVIIEEVDPGDAVSASAGIGIAFNSRTTVNFGYAHTWAFGTTTKTRMIDAADPDAALIIRRSRDLQIGRFLFGVTYRLNDRASLNWSVEVGATDDATDLRTVIRIPISLRQGR